LIRKLAIFAVSNKLVQYICIHVHLSLPLFSTQEQAQHVVPLQKKKVEEIPFTNLYPPYLGFARPTAQVSVAFAVSDG
jgi:hypothetical protein